MDELNVVNEIEVVENNEQVLPEVDSEGGSSALAVAGVVGGVVTVGYLGYRFIAKPIAKKVKVWNQKRKDKKAGVVTVDSTEVVNDEFNDDVE